MKINTKITLESMYKEDIDSNSVSFTADLKITASEFLTTLRMAENSMLDLIKNSIEKQNPKDTNLWLKTITLEQLYKDYATKEKSN